MKTVLFIISLVMLCMAQAASPEEIDQLRAKLQRIQRMPDGREKQLAIKNLHNTEVKQIVIYDTVRVVRRIVEEKPVEQIVIAIRDFNGIGISKGENFIISEKFKSSIINQKHVKVMERDEIDQILQEQAFQNSGACNSESCLIEIGQLLGVPFIIAGRTCKASDILSLSIRMIDVRTGEIKIHRTVESQSDFYSFLSEVESLANNINL